MNTNKVPTSTIGICSCAPFGFQIALLITLPFWLDRFNTTGSSFDNGFLERTTLLAGRLPHIDYASGLIATIGLAVVFTGLTYLVRRNIHKFFLSCYAVLWVVVFVPFMNYIRISADISTGDLMSPVSIGLIVLLVVLVAYFIRYRSGLLKGLEALNTIGLFIGAVILINGFVALVRTAPGLATVFQENRLLAKPIEKQKKISPVIWIIYDEWDYRISFEDRPRDLTMASVDQLASESFVATNAFPPGQSTAISMPTLTTGLKVTSSRQGSGGDLNLKTQKHGNISWRKAKNVFDVAKERGASSAILSHQFGPYCGSMHSSVVACWEIGKWWQEKQNAIRNLSYVLSYGLRFFPGIRLHIIRQDDPNYRKYSQIDFVNDFTVFQNTVEKRLRTKTDDLLFVHYEIPHYPVQFDRRAGKMRAAAAKDEVSIDHYADNLALVDRTVHKLRQILIETGRWTETALIISSDHHFRHGLEGIPVDLRVPLIVKLPGKRQGFIYRESVNTVTTTKLIPALLSGEITDYQTLAKFIGAASVQ